ncbi:MAG: hypothetical protein LBV26_04230 [Bacteroidales bacterium]|jgi:hypothetical protein|nr:hypothetical protein [Bacteroidales bacterium]
MTKAFTFLFIAALPFWLASCLDSECMEATEASVKVFFYDCDTVPALAVTPDSLTLYGVGNAVKIYDNQKITAPALLPLKESGGETEFIININGTADTVRFVYSGSLRLVSKECGYAMSYAIDTVCFTANEIDSITITNHDVTVQNTENIAIFY